MEIKYNPACSRCRQIAGKDPAGVLEDSLCVGHLREEVGILKENVTRLEAELSETKIMLAAADNGLMKASNLKSGWQGINKECKLWQEKAERLESEVDRLTDALKEIEQGNIYPRQIALKALSGGR